jgi:hypothetical protein
MFNLQKYGKLFGATAREFSSPLARQTWNRLFGSWLPLQREADPLDRTETLLKQLASPSMPADLPFRIRQRIRQERAKAQRATWTWKLQTWLSPIAVPAGVGLLTAVVCFGTFVRIFEIPVQAKSGDVPLALRTPPRLRPTPLVESNNGIDCMKVQLLIDENGRVADFKIIKGKQTPQQLRSLQNLLLFTVFDPATVFGAPTADTVTLALRDGYLKSVSL